MNHLDAALAYAAHRWLVFPLAARSKVPALPSAHRPGDPLRGTCRGGCGREGHGCLDATDDEAMIERWWTSHPEWNIGGRPPEGHFVLDVDPRHGGDVHLRQLIEAHGGDWHRTCTSLTGGGGWHFLFRQPAGCVSQSRLPEGVEVKTAAGYVVLPPSVHPSGQPYRWRLPVSPVVDPVPWLADLMAPQERQDRPPAPVSRRGALAGPWRAHGGAGESPADWFSDRHRWGDVLRGWDLVAGDGDGDGSRWRHPSATSAWSATIRHGLLFCYSPNAGLPVTEPGAARGLTKFRAWAELVHRGDLSEAARAARQLRERGWAA
jgi:hypothetical protein